MSVTVRSPDPTFAVMPTMLSATSRGSSTVTVRPALSRADNSPICPDCGTREALESIGVGREEQDKILGIIHEKYEGEE